MEMGATALTFWSQSLVSMKYPSDPTWVGCICQRDTKSRFSSMRSSYWPGGEGSGAPVSQGSFTWGGSPPWQNFASPATSKPSPGRCVQTGHPKYWVPGRMWAASPFGSLSQRRYDPAPPFCLPLCDSSLG